MLLPNYYFTVEDLVAALSTPTLPITLFIGLFGLIIVYYHYRIHKLVHDSYNNYDEVATKNSWVGNDTQNNRPSPQLRSIGDFNKNDKKLCNENSNKSTESTGHFKETQFHNSTYYYAHNKYKSGGGYSDGLSAEDYTMNGPRLLSKNGISFMAQKNSSVSYVDVSDVITDKGGVNKCNEDDETNTGEASTEKETTTTRLSSQQPKVTIPITKYLWEDTETVSKIRIESIPSSLIHDKNTEIEQGMISWSQANIQRSDVQIRVLNDRCGFALLLKRQWPKEDGETHYLLHLPNLYGKIDGASTVWKSNRLLVKLIKANGYKFSWPSISSAGASNINILETTIDKESCSTSDQKSYRCIVM